MKITSSLLLGAITATVFTLNVARAGTFDDAIAAYDRGDFQSAFQKFMPAAESGNPDAQANVGAMYANGEGVEQNLAEAAKWYRLSAEQGNASAQNRLGSMYDDGVGVTQDFEEAAQWV